MLVLTVWSLFMLSPTLVVDATLTQPNEGVYRSSSGEWAQQILVVGHGKEGEWSTLRCRHLNVDCDLLDVRFTA